jgi:hypothetical protein
MQWFNCCGCGEGITATPGRREPEPIDALIHAYQDKVSRKKGSRKHDSSEALEKPHRSSMQQSIDIFTQELGENGERILTKIGSYSADILGPVISAVVEVFGDSMSTVSSSEDSLIDEHFSPARDSHVEGLNPMLEDPMCSSFKSIRMSPTAVSDFPEDKVQVMSKDLLYVDIYGTSVTESLYDNPSHCENEDNIGSSVDTVLG